VFREGATTKPRWNRRKQERPDTAAWPVRTSNVGKGVTGHDALQPDLVRASVDSHRVVVCLGSARPLEDDPVLPEKRGDLADVVPSQARHAVRTERAREAVEGAVPQVKALDPRVVAPVELGRGAVELEAGVRLAVRPLVVRLALVRALAA